MGVIDVICVLKKNENNLLIKKIFHNLINIKKYIYNNKKI